MSQLSDCIDFFPPSASDGCGFPVFAFDQTVFFQPAQGEMNGCQRNFLPCNFSQIVCDSDQISFFIEVEDGEKNELLFSGEDFHCFSHCLNFFLIIRNISLL